MSSNALFQIYFDDITKVELSPVAIPIDNSYGLIKKITPAFENHVIKNIFDKKLYGDAERVGVFSWAFEKKNWYKLADLDLNQSEDVLTFYWHAGKTVQIYKLFEKSHPGIMDLSYRILKEAGYDIDVENIETPPIYQNAHITKTEIYKRYVDEMLTPVMNAMFHGHNNLLMENLFGNSYYKIYDNLDTEKMTQITSKPYYTYHTFICETLPALYFALNPEITIKII